MAKIGNLIKESIKNELGFEEKPWEIPFKLFQNLKSELEKRNLITEYGKKGHIRYIHFEIIEHGKSFGVHKARPVLRNDRMYLSFKTPKKLFIEASYIFGEEINQID